MGFEEIEEHFGVKGAMLVKPDGKLGADVIIDPAVNSPYESWAECAATGADEDTRPLGTAAPLRQGVYFECVGVPGVIEANAGGGSYYNVSGNAAALKVAFLDIIAKSQPPTE